MSPDSYALKIYSNCISTLYSNFFDLVYSFSQLNYSRWHQPYPRIFQLQSTQLPGVDLAIMEIK